MEPSITSPIRSVLISSQYLLCGKPAAPGEPYCREHAARAFGSSSLQNRGRRPRQGRAQIASWSASKPKGRHNFFRSLGGFAIARSGHDGDLAGSDIGKEVLQAGRRGRRRSRSGSEVGIILYLFRGKPAFPRPAASAFEHSWVRLTETIADASFGKNMGRPLRVRLDLLAQGTNVDTKILHVGVAAPNLL